MLQLQLPDEFKEELQRTIGEVYRDAVKQARTDTSINIEYLTKQQAMDLYSLSNNTLMAWTESGLPMYRINGKIYFNKKRINEFIEQHQI